MKLASFVLPLMLLAALGSASAQDITNVSPSTGSLGDTLTITGTGLGGPTGLGKPSAFLVDPVTLKKLSLKVLTFSDTVITAQVTKAAYGALDLSVQPKGAALITEDDAFTVPQPVIDDVLPLDESGTIGTEVTISGSGLLGVVGLSKPKVQLFDTVTGKKYALKVTTFSSAEVKALISKAVAGSLELQLIPKGGATLIASADFEVPLPNISAIAPGFAFANETVTLTCENVGDKKPKVKLGKKTAKVVTFSDTQVTFVMPKKLPKGVQTMTLTNKVGTATNIGFIAQGDVPDTSTEDSVTATAGKIKFVADLPLFGVLAAFDDGPPAVLTITASSEGAESFVTDHSVLVKVPSDITMFTGPVGFVDAADGIVEFSLPNPDVSEIFAIPHLARWSSDAVGGSYTAAILAVEPVSDGIVLVRGAFSGTLKLVAQKAGFAAADTVTLLNGEFVAAVSVGP